jgi:hypothetical protein
MVVMKRQIENRVRISCWCGIVWMRSPPIYGPDSQVLRGLASVACQGVHYGNQGHVAAVGDLCNAYSLEIKGCSLPRKQRLQVHRSSLLDCCRCMQLQRMGLSAVATGEVVAPFLVGIPASEQKKREVTFADTHHDVSDSTAEANNLEATAAGLRGVQALMDWYGMGYSQVHSPARLGREVEDILCLQESNPLPRRAISLAEVCLSCSRLSTLART